jgi:hypothetical protein
MKGINNTIKWEMHCSFSGTEQHMLLYRSEFMGRGVQMEIVTPVINDFDFGDPVTVYFIDGVDAKFETIEDMIKHITQ